MAVKSYDQNESEMKFITVLTDLETFLVKRYPSKPKKLKFFYNRYFLTPACDALSSAKFGNSIKVKTRNDFSKRREAFLEVLGKLGSIDSHMSVYYSVYKNEGMTKHELDEIAEMLKSAYKLTKGVLNADLKRHKKLVEQIETVAISNYIKMEIENCVEAAMVSEQLKNL